MRNDHILIMRFSSLGDVAMLVPVVHSLAMQYPHLRITVLSREFGRPFFEGLAPNVSFMDADFVKEYRGLTGLNALYRRLKAKHFTSIADMHDVLRTKYLRIRFKVDRFHVAHLDKHKAGKKRLVSRSNKRLVQQSTSFQNYADVLARLGYPVQLEFRSLFPPQGGNLRVFGQSEYSEKNFGLYAPSTTFSFLVLRITLPPLSLFVRLVLPSMQVTEVFVALSQMPICSADLSELKL